MRHNLSLNQCFIKVGQSENGKGNYWTIHPACRADFSLGDFSKRHARRRRNRSKKPYDDSRTQPSSSRSSAGFVPMAATPVGNVGSSYYGTGVTRLQPFQQVSQGEASTICSDSSTSSNGSSSGYLGYQPQTDRLKDTSTAGMTGTPYYSPAFYGVSTQAHPYQMPTQSDTMCANSRISSVSSSPICAEQIASLNDVSPITARYSSPCYGTGAHRLTPSYHNSNKFDKIGYSPSCSPISSTPGYHVLQPQIHLNNTSSPPTSGYPSPVSYSPYIPVYHSTPQGLYTNYLNQGADNSTPIYNYTASHVYPSNMYQHQQHNYGGQ